MTTTVKAECRSCDGTGLYVGFAEPKGTAVVCLTCDGTGCEEIRYAPFTKRKSKRGIQRVQRARGTFLATGVGPDGKEYVTYAEFQKGKMPP
jgi:hypothetical protein